MPDPTKETVSASQVAALFNQSPYFTRFMLYQHFAGDFSLDVKPDERMNFGKMLQPVILQMTAEQYRLEVRENLADDYTRNGPIGATMDGLMIAPDRGPMIVEAKNVDWFIWKDQWTEDRAPLHIELQVQTAMAAARADYAVIACLVGGNDLRFYERTPNLEVRMRILDEAHGFLESVRLREPPPMVGLEIEIPALAAAYPTDIEEVLDATADPQATYDIRMFEDARARATAAVREQKELQAKIIERAAGATRIKAQGWECTIKRILVSATVCQPHAVPKEIRKPTIQHRITCTETGEVRP